jgi:hypothetical protein
VERSFVIPFSAIQDALHSSLVLDRILEKIQQHSEPPE